MRPIRVPFLSLLFGLVLAMPSLARAHETLPANWCADPNKQTPQIVATFSFSEAQIRAMAQQVEQTLGPEGLIAEGLAPRMADGRCGIVDRWRMATYIAQQYCSTTTSAPGVIANITGPGSYLGPLHHQQYTYVGGLQGACAICVDQAE
jgi:hypothetical protein